MKKIRLEQPSTVILRVTLTLIGLAVLALCVLWVPAVIGTFQPGGYDPILLSLYIPAVPFFIALLQSSKLLSLIDAKRAFSVSSVEAFRAIKACALIICGFFVVTLPYVFYVADKDDAPGVVAIALILAFLSFVIGTFAAVLQKLFQNAVRLKSENDLTV
jgi:hypothetical protein